MKTALLFFIVLGLWCSCFNVLNNGEPVYTPRIVWQTKINYRKSWAYPFESGGYGYYPEESCHFSAERPYYARLVKIDLNNGKIIWRTDNVPTQYTDQAQKIGEYIYLPLDKKDLIMVYNDFDGSLAATVSLNSGAPTGTSLNGVYGCHTAVWGKYIFWGNNDSPTWSHQGLMRFDTGQIDFTREPATVQLIEPQLVYPVNWQSGITTNIAVKDGIVYFLTSRHWWTGGVVMFSHLAAVNAETGAVLWVTKRDHGWGERDYSLLVNGDRLYVIDRNPCCYNRWTGEPIFEKKDDVYEYTDAGSSLAGISFYNNKLYYTTGMHSHTYLQEPTADPARIKNIICIDGDTGSLVWGDLVPDGASIFTFPLVNKGKAYVVTDLGLRVYHAETGKLIGVDKTVDNMGNNHNLLYNDMVIYPDRKGDYAEPKYAILTAIRAD